MTSRRLRDFGVLSLVVAMVAGIVTAAVRADAPPTTRASTNDGGAWLVNRASGAAGHVNRAVGEVSGVLRIADAGAEFDVEQAAGVVVVHDRSAATLSLVDPRTYQSMNVISLPRDRADRLSVLALPAGAVVWEASPLRVWTLDRNQLAGLADLDEQVPTIDADGPGSVIPVWSPEVDPSATAPVAAAVLDVAGDRLVALRPVPGGLAAAGQTQLDGRAEAVQGLTAVGERVALVSGDHVAIVDLPELGDDANGNEDGRVVDPSSETLVLQQPALPGALVHAIDATGTVFRMAHDDGDREEAAGFSWVPLADTGAGGHLPPIAHGGCLFTVATEPPTFSRLCGDAIDQVEPLPGVDPTALRLRLVNGWVWINDLTSGAMWVASAETDLERIDSWGTALGQSGDEPESEESSADDDELDGTDENPDVGEIRPQRINEDGVNNPPVARDDTARTRVDQPVVVDVLANDVDPDGDALMVTSVSDVPDGVLVSLTADQRKVQVVPPAGSTAPIRFGYTVSDGRGGTDTAMVDVEVVGDGAPNRPPVAVTDVAEVRAGASASFNVLNNDVDPDGDSIVLTDVRAPAGRVIFDPSGEVVYTPDPSATAGTIELEYDIADTFGATNTGIVRVAIRLDTSNNRPNAVNDTAVTVVGTPVTFNVLRNDTDPDNDPLIVAGPPQLVADGRGGDGPDLSILETVSLSPDGEFFFLPEHAGDFVFLYTISDGSERDSAYIRVRVDDVDENRPPVAVRDDVTIPRGETRNVYVLENDVDPDGDVLGIVSWTEGDGLRVEQLDNVGFRVTALPDAPEQTQFRYSISDGVNEPSSAPVVVAVSDAAIPDQPPVTRPNIVEVRPGRTTSARVLMNDFDPEGGPLRVVNVSSVPGAQLRIGPGGQEIFVSVDEDVTSSFTFSYDVADEADNVSGSFVQVRLVPPDQPNRPPIARPDVARTIGDRPIDIPVLINDSDPDGDAIMLESIAAQPLSGTAEVRPDGTVRYTPSSGFGGSDRFRYTIVDANGDRAVGDVIVGVLPADGENRPPTAVNDNYTVIAGSDAVVLDVLANDFDPDGDPLRITEVATTSNRVEFDADDNSVRFTPPDTVEGGGSLSESFTYTIDDGRGGTDSALVTVEVVTGRQPLAPVAVDDLVGPVRAGSPVAVNVLDNDFDPDGRVADLTVRSLRDEFPIGDDGLLEIEGLDETTEIPYEITDLDGLTDRAVVTVLVLDNVAPVVEPLRVETEFETPVVLDLGAQATDADGDVLQFVCCDNVRSGSATILDSADDVLVVEFTPDPGFSGEAGLAYVVDDQQGHRVAGAVTVVVAPRDNTPPTAVDATVEVEAGSSSPVSLAQFADDPDLASGDELSFSLTETRGAPVSLGGSTVVVSPPIDAAGAVYEVDFQVSDLAGETASARLTVQVTEANVPAPTAVADTARTTQGAPVTIDVLANDVDPLGQGLTITGANVTDGSGTARVEGDRVVYTPNPDFFGSATFTYQIEDPRATASGRAVGSVTVTVVGLPGTPTTPQATAGNATATVTWTLPPNNGAPIDGVEFQIDDETPRLLEPTSGTTLSDLENGRSYRFRVRASNEAGWGPWSEYSAPATPDTRPGRPAAPTATFGDGRLTVTWNEPANEGSALTGYELEIGGGESAVRALGTGTTYTWDELENGTRYQFRVVAVNAAGQSDPSAWSDPEHPLRAPDAPGVPDVARGNRSLDLSWSGAAPNGDPVIEYRVELRSDPGRYVPVGTDTSYRWANLPNGVEQQFRVQARNRDPQWGAWSDWSAPVKPCTVPDRPDAPGAQRGDRQAVITYTVPDDQGCSITEMQVRASDGSVQTLSGSPHTFTGLTNGTSYDFQVRARNEEGWGAWSASSPAVTPAGAPIGPSTLSSQNVAPGTVRLTWSAANANGAPISRYEIRINGGSAQSVGNVTTHDRSGLNDATTYTFNVRACNEIGCGSWSSGSTTTTWGAPNQVARPNASASQNSNTATVSASWNAPANNGSAIVEYQAQLRNRNTGSTNTVSKTASQRSHTWSASNGVSYDVRVRARNAVGWGPWSTYSQAVTPTAPPPPTTQPPAPDVRISKGRAGGCTSESCRWIDLSATNLTPNTSYTIRCYDEGTAFGSGRTATSTSNGSLNVNDICFFGFPGRQVWATVNPGNHRSNTITW